MFSFKSVLEILILGNNTSNLTATKQLLLDNSQTVFWRFEVTYEFLSGSSTSALDFTINRPPGNGSCSIDPISGTTNTLFNILCQDWFDEDGIKDYSLNSMYICSSALDF